MKYKAKDSITSKTIELIKKICKLSDGLPDEEVYRLKDRLNSAVNGMSGHIEDAFIKEKRIDKVRSMIKAESDINEAKTSLNLVKQMNYSDTKDLIKELDEVNHHLKTECGSAYTA